jgi:hypothetical protein
MSHKRFVLHAHVSSPSFDDQSLAHYVAFLFVRIALLGHRFLSMDSLSLLLSQWVLTQNEHTEQNSEIQLEIVDTVESPKHIKCTLCCMGTLCDNGIKGPWGRGPRMPSYQ